MREVFGEFGEIAEVVVLRDRRTSMHQGCCFVKYTTLIAAQSAINALHNQRSLPPLRNPLQVRFADSAVSSADRGQTNAENKLFIGGVPHGCGDKDLRQLFHTYGEVLDVYILASKAHQEGQRGCAFVRYATQQACAMAIEALHGKYAMKAGELPLVVRYADPPKSQRGQGGHGPHNGFGGGGRGGHGFGPQGWPSGPPAMWPGGGGRAAASCWGGRWGCTAATCRGWGCTAYPPPWMGGMPPQQPGVPNLYGGYYGGGGYLGGQGGGPGGSSPPGGGPHGAQYGGPGGMPQPPPPGGVGGGPGGAPPMPPPAAAGAWSEHPTRGAAVLLQHADWDIFVGGAAELQQAPRGKRATTTIRAASPLPSLGGGGGGGAPGGWIRRWRRSRWAATAAAGTQAGARRPAGRRRRRHVRGRRRPWRHRRHRRPWCHPNGRRRRRRRRRRRQRRRARAGGVASSRSEPARHHIAAAGA